MLVASRFRRQYLSAKWDRKLLKNELLKRAEIENGSAANIFYSLSIDNANVWYAFLMPCNIFSSVCDFLSCET